MKTTVANGLLKFMEEISSECTGKLGYAVARNMRLLKTELTEYNDKRNELIRKYGTEKDGMISIENGSEAHFNFLNEMKEYEDIDIEVKLMKVDEEQFVNSNLSADKMSVLMDFMFEEKSE